MFVKDSNREELIQQRTLELRASEERFHNIISISTDGIVIVDGFGMILFCKPDCEIPFRPQGGGTPGRTVRLSDCRGRDHGTGYRQ
jgi:hypothetical protein